MESDKTKVCDALLEEFKSREGDTSKAALSLVMTMLLKHTAEMLEVVVEAVAEKYGHSVDEMMEVVKTHPKFTGLAVDPALHDLAGAAPADAKKRGRKKLVDMTPEERAMHEARVSANREKREAKKSAESSPAYGPATAPLEPAPLEPAPLEPAEPVAAPVKRVFTIKPKKKVEAA